MKRILLILSLILLLGCAKEEEPKPCNCGLVIDDNVSNYSVLIRNNCSGNEKWFTLYRGDWINAHVGYDYCIYNVDSW